MRYRFIDGHRGVWPIRIQCRVLEVTPSGYYTWRGRPASPRTQRCETLEILIKAIHGESKERYGSPRVHAELVARGLPCCVNTVAKLMRQHGIRARIKRKYRHTTDSDHNFPVAENYLGQQFQATAMNQIWLADITYIPTREGWLYLAAVEDLYSRQIVGWSMSERVSSRLVADALEMAVRQRLPEAGLVAHSDRGSQYASYHYRRLLEQNGLTCSMSRRGNCWDNAPMESFFATLKGELIHNQDYRTREEARASVFEYIEIFYNRVRRHSALGYKSPAEFEQTA